MAGGYLMSDNETNDGDPNEGNGTETDAGQTAGGATGGQDATGGQGQTGGQSTGGQATGGQPTGGQATGGQATGGQSTGGQATAGQATGGQTPGAPTSGSSPASDLEPNVAGALAYVLGWISGLFFFFTEEEDDFVRFHAAQSIVVFGGLSVAYVVVSMVMSSLLFSAGGFGLYQLISLLTTLLMLAALGLWLGLMYMAYEGRWYELPLAGDVANNLISNREVTVERKATGD